MCVNCPDMIDMCWQGDCVNPNGGPYNKYAKFYVGDLYCIHLKPVYGHDFAEWADLYKDDDETTEDNANGTSTP